MDSIFPLEAPLKLVPGDYISETPVTLCIQDKFLSIIGGRDFSVVNTHTGEKAFKVEGRALSFKDTKVFATPDGKTKLFRINYHRSEVGPYFLAERLDLVDVESEWTGDGNIAIFTAQEKKLSEDQKTMEASLYILRDQKAVRGPRLILRGTFDNGEVVLQTTGQVVALLHRTTDDAFGRLAAEADPSQDAYFVTVAPGMDYAAMAGIAVCFNELHNKTSRSHSRAGSRSASRSRPTSRAASRSRPTSRAPSPSRVEAFGATSGTMGSGAPAYAPRGRSERQTEGEI